MKKELFKNILIIFLVALAGFSVYKYAVSLRGKNSLLDSLNQLKDQAQSLEKEKQNLLLELNSKKMLEDKLIQDNLKLKGYFAASQKRLVKLFRDYSQVSVKAQALGEKFSILKVENNALLSDKEQLASANQELKVKLSSIVELKKAIKELKKQMRQQAREIKQKPKLKVKKEVISGNRGFIIKGGQPTYSYKVKIEVSPAL